MATEFSEASRLLIQNWETVREIRRAEGELNATLSRFLTNMRERLKCETWWADGWLFVCQADAQMYITRKEWKRLDDHAVWIGVEGFTADALFGTADPAWLYLWVSGKREPLVEALRAWCRDTDAISDDIGRRGGYVVSRAVCKCLPEELDRFDEVVGSQIIEFFTGLGREHGEITRILKAVEAG